MSKSSSNNTDVVQPLYLSSDKELSTEFQPLYKYLLDIEADWSKRSEHLRKLKAIVLGGAAEFESFYPLLYKLVPGLNAQLNDLRSSISRDTGQIICLISEICQEKLEGISEKLMNKDALIKLISNANKILSEVGHQCICSLIENVKSVKFIPKIFEETSNKNISVRSKCAFYMDLILKSYPPQIIEKNGAAFEAVIEKLICDANKETRTSTRSAFFEYQNIFPSKAQKLYAKFDNATQKALNDDRNKEPPKSNNNLYTSQVAKKETLLTSKMTLKENNEDDALEKETFTSKGTKKGNTLYASKITQKESNDEEDLQEKETFSKTTGFVPPKYQSKTPDKKVKEVDTKKQNGTHRTANSSTALNNDDDTSLYNRELDLEDTPEDFNMKTYKSDKVLIDKRGAGNGAGLVQKKPPIGNGSNAKSKNKTYGEMNQKKNNEDTQRHDELTVEYVEKKQPISVSSQDIKKKNLLSTLNEKQKAESFHKKQDSKAEFNREEEEIPEQVFSSKVNAKEAKKKEEVKKAEENIEEIVMRIEEDLDGLLEKAENTNWSVRATSFEKMCDLFSEVNKNNVVPISKPIAQRMLAAHINHLLDPHFKVVQSCLNSLSKILPFYWDSISLLNLENLVSNLLVDLADSKDKVYSKANVLLNLLEKLFAGDDLVGALYKALESTNKIKVKICALEALILVIKNCETYFTSYTNLKAFVVKIANLVTENLQFKQILLPCFGVLLTLKEKNLQAMMSCILSLTPALISNLRLMASQIAPELEENIKEYIQKTMKDVKKENPKLAKQGSREENTPVFMSTSNNANNLNNEFLQSKNGFNSKPQTNENLMDIEEEKSPMKPPTTTTISNNFSSDPKQKEENLTNSVIPKEKKRNSINNEFEDIKKIENVLRDIKANNDYIMAEINNILVTLGKYLESNISKYQENSLKLMKKLFTYFDNYQKLLPETISRLFNLYHLNHQETHHLDELFEILIPKTNKITLMKALVDKTSVEKSPYLQIMIKWIGFVVKISEISEIRPFLDHIIDIFKIAINDASPDVRKSVVFCMVDLYFLFKNEIEPYFQMFHPNQQKLIMIYIKRKTEK